MSQAQSRRGLGLLARAVRGLRWNQQPVARSQIQIYLPDTSTPVLEIGKERSEAVSGTRKRVLHGSSRREAWCGPGTQCSGASRDDLAAAPLRRCALFRSARSQRQCLCRCRRRRPCKDRSLDSYDVTLNSGMFWLLVQPKTCKKHRLRTLSNCSGRKRYFLLPASLFSLTSLVHAFVRCLTAVLGPLPCFEGKVRELEHSCEFRASVWTVGDLCQTLSKACPCADTLLWLLHRRQGLCEKLRQSPSEKAQPLFQSKTCIINTHMSRWH